MDNIEKLYYNMDKLNDDYADTEEVKIARDKVEKTMGSEKYFKHEDEITTFAASSEKQGFVIGFRYTVSLLTGGKTVTE